MCGYDTVYALDSDIEADDELRAYACESGRLLVTRDRELARNTEGAIGLDSHEIDGQLSELLDAGFSLSHSDPVRCSICNGPLHQIETGETTASYAPAPAEQGVALSELSSVLLARKPLGRGRTDARLARGVECRTYRQN